MSVMEYVFWYNNNRLHSYCGHATPNEFENHYYSTHD
ncbi:MAG: IS3 family transposase [Pseudonocardiaceae bacterium]|nr:IS3 family transposase [Pseudonocardiaceae bacterium]